MTVGEFSELAGKLRPYSDYLYLHVMGEPLLHPQLAELLHIAKELGFRVIITTNGTLLPQVGGTLLQSSAVYKIHVSLHSFEANRRGELESYVDQCADFAQKAALRKIIVNFRLWNLDGAHTSGINSRNEEVLSLLQKTFPAPWHPNTWGFRLRDGVFIQYAERFDWPDAEAEELRTFGRCYALRKQLAVLCDGSVVPCCLDHEGELTLGNLFREPLDAILAAPPAQKLLQGVRGQCELPELCRRCGYAGRFSGER